jgi:alpha-glucuronidase
MDTLKQTPLMLEVDIGMDNLGKDVNLAFMAIIEMQKTWNSLEEKIDQQRFNSVKMHLKITYEDA